MPAQLQFEHLIQINDPADSRVPAMTRAALWQGLVYRARYPAHFNPSLDVRLEEDTSDCFVRVICVGELELRDQVSLLPGHEIRTLIDGATQAIHAATVTRIEEPEPGFLFVRFSYQRDSIADQAGPDADEYLKNAYVQIDRDAIAEIRQLIADGWDRHLV